MSRIYGTGTVASTDKEPTNPVIDALLARYGQDPSSESRSLPKPRGATVVAPGAAKYIDAEFQPSTLWWTPESDDAMMTIPRPACAGSAHLAQLILNHLRSSGLGDVAAVFAQEMKAASLPPDYSDVLRAPIQMAQPSLTQSSALTHLLCPLASTRSQIKELLASGAQVFPASVEGCTHDQMTLHHLITQFEEPMWADVSSPTSKHRIYSRPDTNNSLRAAPINAMIEQLTKVAVRPHINDSEAAVREAAAFRRKFFATHRHFCSSRVVLAKLMQRFMVPCSLPLALQYDAHGILVDCHPKVFTCEVQAVPLLPALGQALTSQSAEAQDNAVWLDLFSRVTKSIQIKVMGVICEWLTMFPEHFDSAMEEALITFVHEACGSPAIPWSNTPIELAQAGEKIKLLLAEQNAAMAAAATARSSRLARAATTGAEQVSGRKRRNIGAPNAEFDIEVNAAIQGGASLATGGTTSGSSLFSGSGGSSGSSSSSSHMPGTRGSQSVTRQMMMVKWDLATLDESKLANQITTVDHFLLRRITVSELFAQSADIGTRGGSSGSMRAASSNVNALLRRGEETMRWLLCEMIWGGGNGTSSGGSSSSATGGSGSSEDFDPDSVPAIVDEGGRAYVREIEKRVLLIQKVVSLAFRLVEMNNLNSAFSVYLALRHPALLRLYDVWRNVPRDVTDNIAELRELFNFEKGYRMYRDYLSSMSDDDLYPVVPVVQVIVDELRRISAEPTVLLDATGSPIVHWRKFDVLGTLYGRFHSMKEATVPAEFCALPPCIAWLENKLHKARQADFETIVRASLKAQPSRRVSK